METYITTCKTAKGNYLGIFKKNILKSSPYADQLNHSPGDGVGGVGGWSEASVFEVPQEIP